MIVDCADTDTEMSTDPFLEAGIDIPKELPYQTPMVKKKFSIIKRRDSKMNEPSPANSCISLARSSSSAMQININQMKNFHKKFAPSRRRKSTETQTLQLEIGEVPKDFYDLSKTAPVVSCEKSNGSSLQFPFQKVQPDLKRSQSVAPSIVVIKPVPNVEQSENKSETIKVVSKVPHKSPSLLRKRVSSIFEESEEDPDGEKNENVEADIDSNNLSKGPPRSPALLKKKVSEIFEKSKEKGEGEKNVEVVIESNNLNINRGFENV